MGKYAIQHECTNAPISTNPIHYLFQPIPSITYFNQSHPLPDTMKLSRKALKLREEIFYNPYVFRRVRKTKKDKCNFKKHFLEQIK